MRSGTNCIINSGQVHSLALGLLVDAKLVKDHGWKCAAAIGLGGGVRPAAQTHAPSGLERRHRLAFAALLRAALPKPQRTLLWPAQAGDVEVSRLCFGLYCRVRT